ncbi:gp53-like domain-containing protein, partial [Xenorhabdus bovienii]|nr:hypothetical protein [Xenorhabdus bovienii]MDE9471339.1 hypothetical protein [Xenorhabdus bovienii]
TWGGFLSHWIDRNLAKKNTGSLGGNGWIRDESTGLILQWGSEPVSNRNFSFPRAFLNECFVVLVTNANSQGDGIDNAFGYPINNSQFFAATKRADGVVNSFPVAWVAIGR